MGGLVDDLLLLAELDRGRPLRAEPVDLHRICADAVGDSNAVPHGHHLSLAPGAPVVVIGDGERLAQVAHNLVRNALAHTPPGTDVTVSTGVAGSHGVHPGVRQRAGHPSGRGRPRLRPLLPGRPLPLGHGDRAGPRHRAGHRRGPARDGRGRLDAGGGGDSAGQDPARAPPTSRRRPACHAPARSPQLR